MKKLISACMLHALLLPVLNGQSKLFDQPVQLKACHISISANHFIATTFIEMEFYNPNAQEVEGFQSFRLNKSQVVTAFQLDLNGKYRDGSIEEKWKANRAYSSIVGKRIDPAILQMSYDNNYTLRIYPIPGHGSRKVTMTIDQVMKEQDGNLVYELPLNYHPATSEFHVNIDIAHNGDIPFLNAGLLTGRSFVEKGVHAMLDLSMADIKLDKPISFSIPVKKNAPLICVSNEEGSNRFLISLTPGIAEYYQVQPKSVHVFWDVSGSASSRNILKEIDFLERYISVNNIERATITLFNQKILNSLVYDSRRNNFDQYRRYLANYRYSGATTLGNLDMASVKADVILLFSDGYNTFGKAAPVTSTVQVNCISSTVQYDWTRFQNIISTTGGSYISLYKVPIDSALSKIVLARNYLMKHSSVKGTVNIHESFPQKLSGNIFLSGTFNDKDQLQLIYGNSNTVTKIENIYLSGFDTCIKETYKKFQLLRSYDSMMQKSDWQGMVFFGLQHKVVTPCTSFLVLERIEDYINYNIAPPKELEAECAQRNYVYKSELKIRSLKVISSQDALKLSAEQYNKYLKWWNRSELPIDLSQQYETVKAGNATSVAPVSQVNKGNVSELSAVPGQNALSEVVVTTAFQVKRTLRSSSTNVQFVSADQLNTVRNADVNNALAGKVAGVQVRSQSSIALGATTNIRLRGENGLLTGKGPIYVLDGTIMDDHRDINIDEVEDITVLQGPAAAALFGPDGANGAIVVNSKRGKKYSNYYTRWREYKLDKMEEVDYMNVIRQYTDDELWDGYRELESYHRGKAGFYFDMADYFFERKLDAKAEEILFEAIELCRNDRAGLRAAAYVLESHKRFEDAIRIYRDMVKDVPGDLTAQRDLALALYQNNQLQEAVNTYYQLVNLPVEDYYDAAQVKIIAINEMNAIIRMHGNSLDLSNVNLNFFRHLPVDVRFTVETNYSHLNGIRVRAPQGDLSFTELYNPNSKNPVNYTWGYRFNYERMSEYSLRNAGKGSYKIVIDSYLYYAPKIPQYVRVVVFKNFQRPNQSMEVEYYVMDNQYGSVEIAEIKW